MSAKSVRGLIERRRRDLAWHRLASGEALPRCRVAIEGIAVDVAPDAGHAAGGGVLPEVPTPAGEFFLRLGRDGAYPQRVLPEGAVGHHVAIEGDVGVDYRPLAGMSLELVEERAHHGHRFLAWNALAARGGVAVPLRVQHRRQCVGIARDVRLEPLRLFVRRAAPV